MELLKEVINTQIGSELITLVTGDQAWHYRIIPCLDENGVIGLYTDQNNVNSNLEAEIALLLNRSVRLIGLPSDQVSVALSRYYRKSENSRSVVQGDGLSDEFVQKLVIEARELGSSDIHIEIYDEKARIRMRIDGHLVERYRLEKDEYPAIINKLKIKASLDIAEKRLPQDGRIMFTSVDKKFDIRVSVLPTLHGEKVVLRLLSNDASKIRIDRLGFSDEELRMYLEGIKKPNGIL
jgi:type IV pilus assembly protein PilB